EQSLQYTTLGRTGLKVSVAGLGCGGFSRLGQGSGKSEAESIAVVRAALDEGVNFFDTAENYKTEEIVGKAIKGAPRDEVVISTKTNPRRGFGAKETGPRTAEDIVASLDASLKRLDIETIDVFHLHGVAPAVYPEVAEYLVPELLKERDKGKFKHLGITETSPGDPEQKMLPMAVKDDHFDVIMVAFHMLHQRAREVVFPLTLERKVGTLIMFAVRVLFSTPGRIHETVQGLVADGLLPQELANDPEPLGFLLHENGGRNIIDAAYRFCRHEPGTDIILFGTGNKDHVKSNVQSICAPPLPVGDVERLYKTFGHLIDVGLDAPGRPAKR
ncbi:MAG: aldo/keto reductase, partial [Pseudomonadota bacterium]